MGAVDPTMVRLSDSLLLSDFMGNHSVYRSGYPNRVIRERDAAKIKEGVTLANYLEGLQEEYGPFSISYGYISPALSCRIVKWQNPTKPSYHRWDDGAAADVCFHRWVHRDDSRSAPVFLAHEIDRDLPYYSRMITYSESPYVCLATRRREVGLYPGDSEPCKPRLAFYENRYVGQARPQFITKGDTPEKRKRESESLVLKYPWQGRGWPSQHNGGEFQFQHVRLGYYVMLSDLLYDKYRVHKGQPNWHNSLSLLWSRQIQPTNGFIQYCEQAAEVLDSIIEELGSRVSIVQGYRDDAEREYGSWTNGFYLEIVPPRWASCLTVADMARTHDNVKSAAVVRRGKQSRIVIQGYRF